MAGKEGDLERMKKKGKKKLKHKKRQIATYYAEDEYGMHDTCSICDAKMINKPYYELSVTYLDICLRCAHALQGARIIRLEKPKPPPKLLAKDEFFYEYSGINIPTGPTNMSFDSKNNVIERHPK